MPPPRVRGPVGQLGFSCDVETVFPASKSSLQLAAPAVSSREDGGSFSFSDLDPVPEQEDTAETGDRDTA